MKHVHVPDSDDQALTEKYKDQLSVYSNEELVEAYNKQARLGMVGVRRQALYVIAMHTVFLDRFGASPVGNEKGRIWGLRGTIVLTSTGFRFTRVSLPERTSGHDN